MQENHEGAENLVISETELKQVVYAFKCNKSTLQVKGKLNSITLGEKQPANQLKVFMYVEVSVGQMGTAAQQKVQSWVRLRCCGLGPHINTTRVYLSETSCLSAPRDNSLTRSSRCSNLNKSFFRLFYHFPLNL